MSVRASVWLSSVEPTAYPALDGDLAVDVVVIGGGITGLTTALALQRHGLRVAVVEARRVGAGTTGHTTGKVTSQHGITYQRLIDRHGLHRARLYAQANQSAIDMVEALVHETGADCGFERAPAYVYTCERDRAGDIAAEHTAAVRLGLPAILTGDVDLPLPVVAALRFDDQAQIHPGRYVTALARTVEARGGRVFEDTRATSVVERSTHAVVRAGGGEIRADHVVVATLLPFVDRGGFFAKARPTRSYGIAARLAHDAPRGMYIGIDEPTRSTRPWDDGDRPGLIVVGEGHPTGQGEPNPARWGELERWAREHFRVESFAHRWSAQDFSTIDAMPYVGRSPLSSRTFVATGFAKWGLTNGTAAAAMLADLIAGETNPWLEAFDATRLGGVDAVKPLVQQNTQVFVRFVKDRTARIGVGSPADLAPGEGGVVRAGGRAVGAYRGPDGSLRCVSITCTHMGCTLRWNAAETSWDCPCHGSRFSSAGDVLDGPAVRPLERIDVDPDP